MAKKAKKLKRSSPRTPRLARKIRASLRGSGFKFLEFGASAVNVMGDTRVYAPTSIVRRPRGRSMKQAGRTATKLINEVPGVTRMLVEILPKKKGRKRGAH